MFTLTKFVFFYCFYLDKGLNQKERIDEVTNIKELQKQGVRDEQGRIAISNTEADENFESERHKNDRDEDVKSGSESNASSDADVIFILYI